MASGVCPFAFSNPLLSPLQLSGQETLPSSTRSWISLGRSFKQMGPIPSSSGYGTTSLRQVSIRAEGPGPRDGDNPVGVRGQ